MDQIAGTRTTMTESPLETPKRSLGDELTDFYSSKADAFEPHGITPEYVAKRYYADSGTTDDYDTWANRHGIPAFLQSAPAAVEKAREKRAWDAAQPESRGSLATFGTALGRGAMDFVSMAGGALSVLDSEPSAIDADKNIIDTAGESLTNWADTTRERSQSLRMTKEEEANENTPGFFQGGGVRGLKKELLHGAEAVSLSAGTAALGAGIGLAAAPLLGVGAGTAAIVGGLASLGGIFFGGTYDKEFTDQHDKIRKINPHASEQEIVGKTKALASEKAGWEAGTEVLSDFVAGAIALGTGGLAAPTAGAIKTGVKGMLRPGLKQFLKRTALGALATVPSETGTEMLSAAMQDKAMADAGLEHMGAENAALSAFIPSLVPSVFFGVGGASIGRKRASNLLRDINSGDAETRIQAVNDLADGISKNTRDKELASAWLRIANQHVIEGKPIDVNEDIAAFAASSTRTTAAKEGTPIVPDLTPEEIAAAHQSEAEKMLTDGQPSTPEEVLLGTDPIIPDMATPAPVNMAAQPPVIEDQRQELESEQSLVAPQAAQAFEPLQQVEPETIPDALQDEGVTAVDSAVNLAQQPPVFAEHADKQPEDLDAERNARVEARNVESEQRMLDLEWNVRSRIQELTNQISSLESGRGSKTKKRMDAARVAKQERARLTAQLASMQGNQIEPVAAPSQDGAKTGQPVEPMQQVAPGTIPGSGQADQQQSFATVTEGGPVFASAPKIDADSQARINVIQKQIDTIERNMAKVPAKNHSQKQIETLGNLKIELATLQQAAQPITVEQGYGQGATAEMGGYEGQGYQPGNIGEVGTVSEPVYGNVPSGVRPGVEGNDLVPRGRTFDEITQHVESVHERLIADGVLSREDVDAINEIEIDDPEAEISQKKAELADSAHIRVILKDMYDRTIGRILKGGGIHPEMLTREYGNDGAEWLRARFGFNIVGNSGQPLDVWAQTLTEEVPEARIDGDADKLFSLLRDEWPNAKTITTDYKNYAATLREDIAAAKTRLAERVAYRQGRLELHRKDVEQAKQRVQNLSAPAGTKNSPAREQRLEQEKAKLTQIVTEAAKDTPFSPEEVASMFGVQDMVTVTPMIPQPENRADLPSAGAVAAPAQAEASTISEPPTRPDIAAKMIDVLRQQGVGIVAGSHIDEAREVMGLGNKGEGTSAPQYQASSTTAPAPIDLRQVFAGSKYNVHQYKDGSIRIVHGTSQFTIRTVEQITPDRVAFKLKYGREFDPTAESIAGQYLPNEATAEIVRGVGDKWTVWHETYHALEHIGVVRAFDQAVLNNAVDKAIKAGTLRFDQTGADGKMMKGDELRAYFVQHELSAREFDRKTTLGRVLQKIADFIDALVNLAVRTSRGVVRDVESGKVMGRDAGSTQQSGNYYQTAPSAGLKEGSKQWAATMRDAGEVPDGWYVHGRSGRQDLDTGTVIQLTRDWRVASQYAGKNGSQWMISPKAGAKIFNSESAQEREEVARAILADYERGRLSAGLESYIEQGGEPTIESVMGFVDESAPEYIVDSAGTWDVYEFQEWMAENGYDFATTPDGAVAINLDMIDKVMVPSEQQPSYQTAQAAGAKPDELADAAQKWAEMGTESPYFKRWFGDSKVVDAEGKPLVVYHGTRRSFDAFEPSRPRGALKNPSGIYFTPDLWVAKEYAQDEDGAWDEKSQIIKAYIKIENDSDGLVIDSSYSGREYVVFKPENIKDVDNRGTFDPADQRIQYQVASVAKSRQFLFDLMDRPETFGPFKALNTQLHKARKSPAFRKLFERIHAASGTQTRSAARSAELAPDILPDYGSGFKATVKELFASGKYTAQDMAEASKVLSICTLSGKNSGPFSGHRLTDDEIAALERGETVTVGATDVTMTKKQIELYRQARAALDQMVNEMATSQAWLAMRGVITNEDIRENGWQIFADNPIEIPDAMARVLAAELNKAQARQTQAEQAAHAFANVDDMAAFAEHGRKLKKLVTAQKNVDKFSKKQLEDGDMDEIIAKREEKIQRLADELGIDPDGAKDSLAEFVKLAKEFKAAEAQVGAVQDAQKETDRIFGEAKKLVDAGYAPLSRFGKYRINVHDADGNLIYVSMYDTSTEANMQRRKLVESFKAIDGAVVGPVRDMPQETWRLYQGQNPEALMLFAKNAGADAEAALQTYYQEALSSRSALKRLIKRQGFAGYSTDLQRIVASFITSGAKRVGTNYHADDIMEIMGDLESKAKTGEVSGDVVDEAVKLKRFVDDPGDAGSGFRSFAANWYMLGSMMSAAWNGTQVVSSSIPELYKYSGSIGKTAKEVFRAYRSMAKNGSDLTAREKAAVKRASQDGTIDSAETHNLSGMATKRMINKLGDVEAARRAGAFLRLWGMPFAWFEIVNRKATFLAAFRQGEDLGVDDPYTFAKDIVDVTQGIYAKTNRPNVARSTAGGAVLTFMQYKIMTLEQISRNMKEGGQARKAAALQLAIIASLGGWAALPFAENLMDLFDAIMQIMGNKAWLTKKKMREAIESGSKSAAGALLEKEAANAVGQFVADFVNTGISAALPWGDVSGRASMGEMLPGVKLLKPSTQFRDSEIFAMAGVPGSMIESLVDASSYAMRGDVGRAAKRLAPNAVAAAVKGVDILATGEIRNASGKKIADGDAIDGALQMIGVQPKEKTRIGTRVRENQELKFLAQQEEKSIIKEWADAYEEKGSKARTEALDAARARLRDWNAKNPEWRIAIKQSQVLRELQNRRKTVAELAVKSAPKELRQSMGVQ